MVSIRSTGDQLRERIERAMDVTRNQWNRTAQTLDSAGVPYAVNKKHRSSVVGHLSRRIGRSQQLRSRLQELIDDPDG